MVSWGLQFTVIFRVIFLQEDKAGTILEKFEYCFVGFKSMKFERPNQISVRICGRET